MRVLPGARPTAVGVGLVDQPQRAARRWSRGTQRPRHRLPCPLGAVHAADHQHRAPGVGRTDADRPDRPAVDGAADDLAVHPRAFGRGGRQERPRDDEHRDPEHDREATSAWPVTSWSRRRWRRAGRRAAACRTVGEVPYSKAGLLLLAAVSEISFCHRAVLPFSSTLISCRMNWALPPSAPLLPVLSRITTFSFCSTSRLQGRALLHADRAGGEVVGGPSSTRPAKKLGAIPSLRWSGR